MRVAVVGATGRIGRLVHVALEHRSHTVVPISRAHGVDVLSGDDLYAALEGVDVVVDVTNSTATDKATTVDFFSSVTARLMAAEKVTGVGHHVVLSIAGLWKVKGNAHYEGKRAQEACVAEGDTPYTVVPATQFHDFAEMVASWTESNGTAKVPPLLVQPVAPSDVAEVLARVASAEPLGRHVDVAGPAPEDLVDMARRSYAARGRSIRLVPTWHTGIFSDEMAGDVLLPSPDAYITPTSFDTWLAQQSPAASESDSGVASLRSRTPVQRA